MEYYNFADGPGLNLNTGIGIRPNIKNLNRISFEDMKRALSDSPSSNRIAIKHGNTSKNQSLKDSFTAFQLHNTENICIVSSNEVSDSFFFLFFNFFYEIIKVKFLKKH